jgi:iron complex transport system substrate-binding protein
MRNKLLLLVAVLLAILAGSFVGQRFLGRGQPQAPPDGQTDRIVSMAPSITETLYALGLGDRVVGVTRFCRYPPEVQGVAKVGGYHNPNFEAVVALKPDLVILLSGEERSRSAFQKLGLGMLVVYQNDVDGILDSFLQIGRVGGAEADAQRIIADIRARMERIRQKTSGRPRPKVLFVILRNVGSGKLEDVYVAGKDGFFDEIIALAGGQNCCPQASARFPVVSAEGILWMDPDVILDLSFGVVQAEPDKETILAAWQQVAEVEAVKTGRVHVLDQDYATVHGPRFILLIEDLARLIHPEIDWQ